MIFFKPYIINNADIPNPYENLEKFKLKSYKEDVEYQGNQYRKLVYTNKNPHSLIWRFGYACLTLLANLAIIPRCIDKKDVQKLWKRARTGHESQVVFIAYALIKVIPEADEDCLNQL